jgi:ferredoxin-NADP reductase
MTVDTAPPRLRTEAFDGTLRCRSVHDVTHDVRTFVFEPSRPVRFLAGQYLTVTMSVGGEPVSRCYTVSSPPTRPDSLAITVKRKPGGLVSNLLHDGLRPGDDIDVRGPFGEFTIAERPSAKYLLLSGGSGITPLMSMTRTLYDQAAGVDVLFVHTAHGAHDRVFESELAAIAACDPHIRVHWLHGRTQVAELAALVPDLAERTIYACGPPGYLVRVRELLAGLGAEYYEERFTVDTATEAVAGAATFPVRFARSESTVDCAADTTVLEAAQRAGITVPFSCGQGMCGTCKQTLVSGSVEMNHNGGIRRREIEQNRILLCCSKPREQLVIDA